MKRTATLATVTAGAVLTLFAAVPVPSVSDVGMAQGANGVATISYTLSDAAAVVTLDIQTNATDGAWASIGGEAVSAAQGDVWKRVETGTRTIKWDGATCWTDRKIPVNGIRAVVTAWALDNTPDYMAVDISATGGAGTQTYYPAADFVPGGVTNDLYKTTMLLMRKIMAKGVKWTMGSVGETKRNADNEGIHLVTLTNNYYMGVYPITQTQWQSVTGYNPSLFTIEGAMRPVEKVCYTDIRQGEGTSGNVGATASGGVYPDPPYGRSFLGILRDRTHIDFDLPSESQWEFAARAGHGEGYWGDGTVIKNADEDSNLYFLGRYQRNGGQVNGGTSWTTPSSPGVGNATAIVGSYAPNSWGLYDMHGNVWEWCLDRFAANISSLDGGINDDASTDNYVRRGGAWNAVATSCRSAVRYGAAANVRSAYYGFRVSCTCGLK